VKRRSLSKLDRFFRASENLIPFLLGASLGHFMPNFPALVVGMVIGQVVLELLKGDRP
jgi:hypothetical protein